MTKDKNGKDRNRARQSVSSLPISRCGPQPLSATCHAVSEPLLPVKRLRPRGNGEATMHQVNVHPLRQHFLLHFAQHLNGCYIWLEQNGAAGFVSVLLHIGSKALVAFTHPSDLSLWSLWLEKTSNKPRTPDLAADPLKLQTQAWWEPRWVRTWIYFDSYALCITKLHQTNSACCSVTIQAKNSSVALHFIRGFF